MKSMSFLIALLLAVFLAGQGFCDSAAKFPGKGENSKWCEANVPFNEGVQLLRSKSFDRAIAKFKQAIEVYPYDSEYFTNLGLAYKKKGDMSLAEESLLSAIQLNPGVWESWS